MLRKLISYVGQYKKQAILTPVTVTGEVIMEILLPFLMAKIIDIGIAQKNIPYILKLGAIMVGMAFVSLIFGALAGRFAAVSGSGFAANLRRAQFRKVQDFSFANIDRFSTASLVTRMTTDIMFTRMTFTVFIRLLARSPLMMIGATIMAVSINARLSIVFLVAIPFLGSILFFVIRKTHPRFVAMFKKYDKMNLDVQENLIAIRVVKAFVRRDYETKKFDLSAEDVMNAEKRAQKLAVILMPCLQFTMFACMVAVSWFGGNQIVAGSMTVGELMSFISYIMQILMSLMMLSMAFITFVISRASMQRILEVLDELPEITDENADPALLVADGSIRFDHVNFSYAKDERNLNLTDINLKIDSGQTVGILGGTGSAKTTFVQLIPRLYDIQSGSLFVGGHKVSDYKLKNLRESVSMVLQKNVLFSGTIAENLRWGNESATDEELLEVCKAAQAHEFISSFPDGYDTELGQGGVNLSGGQKQRLCIARALLKNPKILILDDSTSAVDTATDAKIRASFAQTRGDMTTIIIAQRVASVKDADVIIILNDGKIDDIGSHEELLERNSIYREVYQSQQEEAAEGGVENGATAQ